MIHLYYDSKTGNVQRFIDKVTQLTGWVSHRIQKDMMIDQPGHLITFTTNFGKIPPITEEFLQTQHDKLFSVSASGNRNWGQNYGISADKISKQYEIPMAFKFELSGTMEDINQFIEIIKNQYYDSKRGSKKLDIA